MSLKHAGKGYQRQIGDLIMFLDADDMLAPCALDIVNDCFDNSIDILVFKMQSVVKSNQVMDVNDDYVCENIPGDRIIQLDMILSGKILSCVCGGAYRHSIISDCKDIFCNRLRIGEDTMFNLELATKKPLRIRTVSADYTPIGAIQSLLHAQLIRLSLMPSRMR